MDPVFWPILLLLAALGLLVLEIFIPSGGLLSVLAAICLVSSLVVAFLASFQFGVTMTGIAVFAVPTLLAAMLKWWPHTPIGKMILVARPEDPDDVLPDTEEFRGLDALIGRRGASKNDMLPSGVVVIGGKPYDAVSEGMPIDAGHPIKVVHVRTRRLIVRPCDGQVPVDDPEADDALSQPLDSLGIDGLEDPLG